MRAMAKISELVDDIMIITCESDIADKLELDELARSWSLLKARRIQVVSHFMMSLTAVA